MNSPTTIRGPLAPAPGSRSSADQPRPPIGVQPAGRSAIQRPPWLPAYIPELQGLRGLAVLAVVIYHSHPRLAGTPLYRASLWGWAGVNLFFVLSGFLITSILLESRNQTHYFRNFYGRRALRIWPVYLLVLALVYARTDWFVGQPPLYAIAHAPWWAYLLFLQNLFHLALPPALGPTWSLAIEEQYYVIWAPVVRLFSRATRWRTANPRIADSGASIATSRLAALFLVLAAALLAAPLFRLHHHAWITPTHTLTHLDGIAMGSLLALGLHILSWSRRTWLTLGLAGILCGFPLALTIAGGTAFLDSALTLGFGGAVLLAIATTGARNPVSALLRRGPLPYYGRISYGLYMTHILVFVYFGWFDRLMDTHGIPGNLAVIAFRLAAATIAATVLWYGFESKILRLKRLF